MVGISGAAAERLVSPMPSARSRPAGNMRIGRGDVDRRQRYLPGEHIDHGRRAATVGNVDEVRTGHLLQKLHGDVLAGMDAGRAVAQAFRPRLRLRDQVLDALRAHASDCATTITPTSISLATGASSRSRSGAVEFGRCGLISSAPVAPTPACRHRAALWRARSRPERTAAADVVLDHHRPAAALAEPVCDRARNAIGRGAGRERHDDPDRFLTSAQKRGRRQQQRKQDSAREAHDDPPVRVSLRQC